MFTDVAIKMHNDKNGILSWYTSTHRYFFWFNIPKIEAKNVHRKPLDAPRMARTTNVNPNVKANKPMVDAVIAYAVEHKLLEQAIEAEAAKVAEERARWKAQRRAEIIGKFGCRLYDELRTIVHHEPGWKEAVAVLRRIDAELTKLDKE